MDNGRNNHNNTDTEPRREYITRIKEVCGTVRQKIKQFAEYPWREKAKTLADYLRNIDYKLLKKQIWRRIKKIRKYTYKVIRKFLRKLSGFPRSLLIGIPTFVFCYYAVGCLLSENIDVKTEYTLQDKHVPMMETAETMSFLLKREVDDKMWTPNLPIVFPAYVLDNMPNFQKGTVHAVRDAASILRYFDQNTDAQKQDIKKATELLAYPPTIWLMNKKDGFNLAPSSNAQYRKAAAQLHKFGKDGVFYPKARDLSLLLQKIAKHLQKLSIRNENWQLEHDTDWIDTRADDLFYYTRGYAFAMWQITKTLGADFKETILAANLYTEWTYLVNSLKKAAEFSPRIVRNSPPQSLFAPNHLLLQNYYILRAVVAAEDINYKITEAQYADKN